MKRIIAVSILAVAAISCSGSPSAVQQSVPGSAAKLAFTVLPTHADTNGVLTPAAQVAVQDAEGRTVTTSRASIKLALGDNSGGATLGGTNPVTAVNGVAVFSDLTVSDPAGTGYTLTASSPGLSSDTSSTLSIGNPATPGLPVKLVFVVQPTTDSTGFALAPAVKVEVEDTTTGLPAVLATPLPITVSVQGHTTVGYKQLGTPTVSTTDGLASFPDLAVDKAGLYTLVATAPSVDSAVSDTFDIRTTWPVLPSDFTLNWSLRTNWMSDTTPLPALVYLDSIHVPDSGPIVFVPMDSLVPDLNNLAFEADRDSFPPSRFFSPASTEGWEGGDSISLSGNVGWPSMPPLVYVKPGQSASIPVPGWLEVWPGEWRASLLLTIHNAFNNLFTGADPSQDAISGELDMGIGDSMGKTPGVPLSDPLLCGNGWIVIDADIGCGYRFLIKNAEGFLLPFPGNQFAGEPDPYEPWTFDHWVQGVVSKPGDFGLLDVEITADLDLLTPQDTVPNVAQLTLDIYATWARPCLGKTTVCSLFDPGLYAVGASLPPRLFSPMAAWRTAHPQRQPLPGASWPRVRAAPWNPGTKQSHRFGALLRRP